VRHKTDAYIQSIKASFEVEVDASDSEHKSAKSALGRASPSTV